MTLKYITLPNVGVLEVNLTEEELAPIKNEIAEIQSNFNLGVEHNKKLAGNIAKEYSLIKSAAYINNLVFRYIREYDQFSDYTPSISVLTDDLPMIIDSPWVNFQAKHEFNPPHHHTGILSFVIWIKVPYKIEDEQAATPSAKSQIPLAGHFSFHYSNILGTIDHYHIPVDCTMENKMIIFPADLTHSVYPFYTSDGYRISVSGNVKFKS